jgi:hypothetical protein
LAKQDETQAKDQKELESARPGTAGKLNENKPAKPFNDTSYIVNAA